MASTARSLTRSTSNSFSAFQASYIENIRRQFGICAVIYRTLAISPSARMLISVALSSVIMLGSARSTAFHSSWTFELKRSNATGNEGVDNRVDGTRAAAGSTRDGEYGRGPKLSPAGCAALFISCAIVFEALGCWTDECVLTDVNVRAQCAHVVAPVAAPLKSPQ